MASTYIKLPAEASGGSGATIDDAVTVSDKTWSSTKIDNEITALESSLATVATSANHSDLTLDDGTNPHSTTKADVGLGNVPNTDATARANHTGTQLASTISDFSTAVQAAETTTSISFSSPDLTYTDEDGSDTVITLPVTTRHHFIQFTTLKEFTATDYLHSFSQNNSTQNINSGHATQGYNNYNSSPILCPFTGTITLGVAAIKGIAVSTGTPSATVAVNMSLYKVGFNSEGTLLLNVEFNVDTATYTVGTFFDSSVASNFTGSESLSISVSEGDLLAVKFVRITGNDDACEVRSPTVGFLIEES